MLLLKIPPINCNCLILSAKSLCPAKPKPTSAITMTFYRIFFSNNFFKITPKISFTKHCSTNFVPSFPAWYKYFPSTTGTGKMKNIYLLNFKLHANTIYIFNKLYNKNVKNLHISCLLQSSILNFADKVSSLQVYLKRMELYPNLFIPGVHLLY